MGQGGAFPAQLLDVRLGARRDSAHAQNYGQIEICRPISTTCRLGKRK
jgi:hypothetical protein